MSEDKQPRIKRITVAKPAVTAPPETEAAPVETTPVEANPVEANPVEANPIAALPAPEPVVALPVPAPRRQQAGADKLLNACHATLASICASQTAIASDMTAMALEIGGLTRSNLTAAGDSVTALFGSRSLVDAVEVQLGFARRSLDAMVSGSTKLAEIGLRLANDSTKPMLGPFPAG
jgi:hypothetical protein